MEEIGSVIDCKCAQFCLMEDINCYLINIAKKKIRMEGIGMEVLKTPAFWNVCSDDV